MKTFLIDMAERAVKTAAQSAIAAIGTTATLGGVDWATTGSMVAIATILSVLSSVVSYNVGDTGTASVVSTSSEG